MVWSNPNYVACVVCGTDDTRMAAYGYCDPCFHQTKRDETFAEIAPLLCRSCDLCRADEVNYLVFPASGCPTCRQFRLLQAALNRDRRTLRNPETARRAKTMLRLLTAHFGCDPDELGDRGTNGRTVHDVRSRRGVAVLLLFEVAGLDFATIGDLLSMSERAASTALPSGREAIIEDVRFFDAYNTIAGKFDRAERVFVQGLVKGRMGRQRTRAAILRSYRREYDRKAEIRRQEGLRWVV